jgi:integrase
MGKGETLMACKVKVNRHGYLAFRFYWNGREFWQGTGWKDTEKNRVKAEGKALEITDEIKAGTFNYLKWFPKGNKAHEFSPKIDKPSESKPQTIKEFFDSWIEKKKPPFVRRSLERAYRQHFNCYILPFMGKLELNGVTIDTLENFRIYLTQEREISLSTAKNVIGGSLQAMFRDAHREIKRNPFNDLPSRWWPRIPQEEPDPFTEQERDAILKYYRANRPYKAYAFVFFRFYTGTRPSEAVALKWGNIDLINAKATITVSRTFKEENAPKTQASSRTVKLLPNVVALLKTILPMRVEAKDYVFTDDLGHPIDQNELGRKFGDVLRVLEIRPRPFYNTRHTYISVALTLGCNPKWIAEQTGTSLTMIQKSYGKYIRDDGDALLVAYIESLRTGQKTEQSEEKTGTFSETHFRKSRNYSKSFMPPTEYLTVVGGSLILPSGRT